MFLSQAVAVLLSAGAAGRGWDTPHRTWPEKLLNMASEIAGHDRSQGDTNVYMVLWGIPRWLRSSHVRNSGISEKDGALCWVCFGVWDSARPTVLSSHISLPTQGWGHLEMVSTIPKFKFNIYRCWKWKRDYLDLWRDNKSINLLSVAFWLVISLISSHFLVWRYLGTRRYWLRIKFPVQHNTLHNTTLRLTLLQLG